MGAAGLTKIHFVANKKYRAVAHDVHPRAARYICMAKTIMASMASTSSAASTGLEGFLSDYYYSLKDEGSKKCYKQKLSLFQGGDPYMLLASRTSPTSTTGHIFSY